MAAINIILGLLENRVEVYVIASKPPQQYQKFIDILKENGASVSMNDSQKKGMSYWKELADQALEVIEQEDIPVAHLHLPKLAYILGKKLKAKGRKLVLTVEGDPIYEVKNLGIISKLKMNIMWKACKMYPDIMCPCSNWLSGVIQSRDKVSSIVTVHNPVDIKRFQSIKTPEDYTPAEGEFVVATAARLTKVKDVETLIKAFADFANKDSRLLILGDGELRDSLESLARDLKVKDKTIFLGFKDNPQDYIASADVFVMPSIYEPFGMPAAEAGAMGIPVIVSKAGGLVEIVEHETTGYHFDIGDDKQLSRYLQKLYQNPDLRKTMGEKAKKRIEEKFAPKVIGQRFLEIYSKL